jgi:class 3 adenylate cyclase
MDASQEQHRDHNEHPLMERPWFRRPWALRRRLGWSLAVVNIIGTLIFSELSYQASRQETLNNIDDILCAAAEGVRQIVPSLIIDQAQGVRTEPDYTETYRTTHRALENYFNAVRLEFLYAIAGRPDGTAFELIGNLSPEQKKAGIDPLTSLLLKPYKPSPGMVQTVRSFKRTIDIAQDEYGYFRSCLVPVASGPDANGIVAIFGADMEISDVNQRLFRDLVMNISIGLVVLLAMLIVVRAISNSVARDVRIVVSETEAVSRLELKPQEMRRHSLILEVDQLFRALFDMKHGLKAFSKYVPNSVIKQVLASGRAEIGGERRELSLLMTDVTDFTTISEQLEPERVMVVMSEYFDNVVAPILKMNGVLDKYVGDAIFAYWNAPLLQLNHAGLCCAAALEAREASKRLAARWLAEGKHPWHTRFGLHAGETVFGNVGAPDRMDFTVIGSSVNLASRIEGLNKYYGTEILVSERMRALAGDGFVFRSIDRVMPKGALRDFEIFELLGTRESTNADVLERVARWEAAYALYKTRKWADAAAAFETYAQAYPGDKVAGLYAARCREFTVNPPSPDWDGVQRFDAK